ncbi:MAG: beta-Ala-His dipeptidase [Halioglobus sp.]|nr:beta-Ala-His dipeptidase [Halioglobus sp.]
MKPEHFPEQPAQLWEHFYRITRIPRPSGQEAAVRQYVIDLAEHGGHPYRMDTAGNLVVSVAASAGMAERATLIIQNHLDMVTVKTAESPHDFSRDPLQLKVVDGWLLANGTTLGADNGVGCAAALALMTDPAVVHPPLELLFTVDEETGLHGALALDPALLTGSRMLNLDTEDWQELFIGCAGGAGWQLRRDYATHAAAASAEFWRLSIGGLAGGHSGIQIHEQLGNAIKLLALCLEDVPGLQLAGMEAGVAHNVIPREGSVEFACEAGAGAALESRLPALREDMLGWLPEADGQVQLALTTADRRPVIALRESRDVLDLVAVFPHGAHAYNAHLPGELVDLSSNLARVRLANGALFVEASYRFFNARQAMPLRQAVAALARAYALDLHCIDGYPGWEPQFDGALLAQASALHVELFGVAPAVKAIHAGLECGIVKSKKPDLDILSFGPTIRGAHSPVERLQIDTVAPFWQFLTTLLARL